LFIEPKLLSRRRLWPGGLFATIAISAIALVVGAVVFSYSSKLYHDRRDTRLMQRATALVQEGKLSKAAEVAHELLARKPDSLPALYVLAETAEKQNLEEAVSWRQQIAQCCRTISIVSSIWHPLRCVSENSMSRDRHSSAFLRPTGTGQLFTLLRVGWLALRKFCRARGTVRRRC
jgi:hypothetical protein